MAAPVPPKEPGRQQTVQRPPSQASRSASAAPRTETAPLAVATRAALERHPYLKMAFANPYNLSMLLGSLAVSAILQEPFLAIASLSAEALWLVFGPGSRILQRFLWNPAMERERRAAEAEAREGLVAALQPAERKRVDALIERQEQIRRLAAQNPSFTGDLLRTELSKTNRLVDAFVEMALNCARYEQYLDSIDLAAMERDRKRYADSVRDGDLDEQQLQIAHKNLDIVDKRLERMNEIHRYLGVARAQLDLMENSFQLIGDQIVTMQSPKELSGQLDELLDGVEAIRETARDTEQILGTIDKEM